MRLKTTYRLRHDYLLLLLASDLLLKAEHGRRGDSYDSGPIGSLNLLQLHLATSRGHEPQHRLLHLGSALLLLLLLLQSGRRIVDQHRLAWLLAGNHHGVLVEHGRRCRRWRLLWPDYKLHASARLLQDHRSLSQIGYHLEAEKNNYKLRRILLRRMYSPKL